MKLVNISFIIALKCPIHKNKFYKRFSTLLPKTLTDILKKIKGNVSSSKDMSLAIKTVKVIKT